MKFLHTADWHIGCTRNFIPDYLERQTKMIDDVFAIAKRNDTRTVVVAGDIFDSADVTYEERDMLLKRIIKYDNSGFRIIIIPGNHDSIEQKVTTLHYLAILTQKGKFRNSYVVEKTTAVTVGDTLFSLLICSGKDFRSHLKETLKEIRAAKTKHKNLVVVTHQTVQGSLTEDGYKLPTGVRIKPHDSVAYYALGDIHLRQKVADRAFYPGSPLQTKFTRNIPKNGVLIVDTENTSKPLFVPIDSKRMVVVDAENLPDVEGQDVYLKIVVGKNATVKDIKNIQQDSRHVKTVMDVSKAGDVNNIRLGESLRSDLKHVLKKKHNLSRREIKLGFKILDGLVQGGVQ